MFKKWFGKIMDLPYACFLFVSDYNEAIELMKNESCQQL
jgi:hypothetical protein